MHRSFSVWHDNQEQWDPDAIDEPALRCQATSAIGAAEQLAGDSDSNSGDFIVRDDAENTYRQISLVRYWKVRIDRNTSLAELSKL